MVILDPDILNSDKRQPGDATNTESFEYLEQNMWTYFVQEQLGETLEYYLEKRDAPFSVKTSL